eukprot:912463-Prorocentrum_minimum.AAC.1
MSLPHRQTLRRSPPAGAAGAPRGTLFWGRTSQGIECREFLGDCVPGLALRAFYGGSSVLDRP